MARPCQLRTPAGTTCTRPAPIGATSLFANGRDSWHGTLMPVFQPGEETAQGAQAMIDDGLFNRFKKPDVVLGQHVMKLPLGTSIGVQEL